MENLSKDMLAILIVSVFVIYGYWIVKGFRHSEIEVLGQHRAKIALRFAVTIDIIFAIALLWPAVILGAFASDSGTQQALSTASLIMTIPFIFFILPAIPKLFYEFRFYTIAYVISIALCVIPLVGAIGIGFLFFKPV